MQRGVMVLTMVALGAFAASTAAVPAANPAHAARRDVASQNKAVVLAYLDLMIAQRRVRAAMERYVAPDYIQHNPKMPSGRAAATVALEALSAGLPQLTMQVKRALAEGDMVMVHSFGQRQPGDRGVAVVDLYRLKNGRIVEHWDVIQEVPDKAMNSNTMF